MLKNTEYSNKVIDAYGGVAKLAALLGVGRPRVQKWRKSGIPAKWLLTHKRKFDLMASKNDTK